MADETPEVDLREVVRDQELLIQDLKMQIGELAGAVSQLRVQLLKSRGIAGMQIPVVDGDIPIPPQPASQ